MLRGIAYSISFVVITFLLVTTCTGSIEHVQMGQKTVPIHNGAIRGINVTFPNTQLKPILAYLGIRYASSYQRFMPPISYDKRWIGAENQVKHAAVCPQKRFNRTEFEGILPRGRIEQLEKISKKTAIQEEDCLTLNIYVPDQGQ